MSGREIRQFDSAASGCWCPAADVYRTADGWLVKFDLAGINPTELELDRNGRRLTVRGVRRDALVRQTLRSYSLEIAYNRFERSLDLPARIDGARIRTDYRDGMLLVWLSRAEEMDE